MWHDNIVTVTMVHCQVWQLLKWFPLFIYFIYHAIIHYHASVFPCFPWPTHLQPPHPPPLPPARPAGRTVRGERNQQALPPSPPARPALHTTGAARRRPSRLLACIRARAHAPARKHVRFATRMMSSTFGKAFPSRFTAYGVGTSAPVTRSTGASK